MGPGGRGGAGRSSSEIGCTRSASAERLLSGYSVHKGQLYYEGRMVIPKGSPLIPKLIQEFHATMIRGPQQLSFILVGGVDYMD